MDRKSAYNRIRQLREELSDHSRRYYVDNAPVISDYEYDHLMYELAALEEEWPEYQSPDSPTRKVGSDLETQGAGQNAEPAVRKEFEQYPHKYPMLSLGNTYSVEEVEDFAARADKGLGREFTYCCELKFDGTAICLNYKDGVLFRALTRGDGTVGDDVTENVLRIPSIPRRLKGKGWPADLEIRGEILMPYESFDRLNRERAEIGEQPFANPRNAASGSLKLLDSEEVGRRGLVCTLYHIPAGVADFATHDEALRAAASWGLPVSPDRRICHGINEVVEFINHWDSARHSLPYATDGVVIKINEMDCQRELGYTAKFPRWAVAYKFKPEEALTELLSIDYQVGRTGAVTPVANLSPVQLSGTVVKRATLNNADQMALLDIRVGDWVYVEKGGEIIPKITRIEPTRRKEGSVPPEFPSVCPDCGTPLVREEGEARWFCPNSLGCPQQIKGRLVHFLSRKAMDVIAGEATVDQLVSRGMVKTPSDFYNLRQLDLMRLDGWQEKSAQRFLSSLEESREVPFGRVLYALGIRYVGETTAKQLAEFFGDIDSLAGASREQLLEVPDIGEVIAESVWSFFRNEDNIAEIGRLKAAGLRFSAEEKVAASDSLAGMTIVISGNFSVSRDEMKQLIESNGGKNSSSVSSKTSFLLAGTKPGPEKIRKAGELGVKVIDESEFRAMIPSSGQGSNEEGFETDLFGGQL